MPPPVSLGAKSLLGCALSYLGGSWLAGLHGEAKSDIGICQDDFVVLLCISNLGNITTQAIAHSLPVLLAIPLATGSFSERALERGRWCVHLTFPFRGQCEVSLSGPVCCFSTGCPLSNCRIALL